MRGTPWLVGLACAMLVIVPTSLFAGAQEPRPQEDRAPGTPDAPRLHEWTGRSVVHFKGACLDPLARCVRDLEREDGTFFLPAPAGGGTVVVSWRPASESLRVLKVRVAGVEVVGESPLRLVFDGLEAGEHAIRIEPARSLVGAHDQSADWVATFAVDAPQARMETRGISAFDGSAACLLGTCTPHDDMGSDTFLAPWTARGAIVAEWDPADVTGGAMRVSVRGTDLAAEGRPPLTLDVYALAPGEYAIDVTPVLLGAPTRDVHVSWLATLEPDA